MPLVSFHSVAQKGETERQFVFYAFEFFLTYLVSITHPEQPGLPAATGPFAKALLLQPGEEVSSLLLLCSFVMIFCSHPAHLPVPVTSPSRQRSSGGRRRPLVSRPWYARGTASLTRWLRPWLGKYCLIVVSFVQPCSRTACACLSIYPNEHSSSRICGPVVGGRGTRDVRPQELEATKVNSV